VLVSRLVRPQFGYDPELLGGQKLEISRHEAAGMRIAENTETIESEVL
jgi:hypothetical protein